MRKWLVIFLFLAAGTASGALRDALNSSTLHWENDNFGQGRKSDRFYTNGVRFQVGLSDATIQPWRWTGTLRDKVWGKFGISGTQPIASVNLILGHNFYTPQIITIAAPQPQDRPWAGVFYAGIGETITDPDQRLSHNFELQAGILGQGAGAQATQKFVHNDLGLSNNDPLGWHNQLRNEPTIALVYQQMRRYDIKKEVFDVVPAFGGMVGSPLTNVNAGATIRLGYHVSGLPVGTISNAAAGLTPPHELEFYVFAGGDARFIPFNATLDGGLLNDGPEAPSPKRFVTDLKAGLSVRWRWARLTYTVVDRSEEFEVPAGAIDTQRFGSFAFTIEPFDTFR